MAACGENFIIPQKVNHSLVALSSGEEKCAPCHSWGAGVRSHYLIHYVISGKGVFYCGTNKYTLKKGQIFAIFPGTIVKYQADESDPWSYTWLSFYGEEAKEILQKAGLSIHSPIATLQNPSEALSIFRDMPRERSADMAKNLKFTARLYELLSLLVNNVAHTEKSSNVYLTTAMRYIKAHYVEDISVDSVADHIGISRKYLFAIFKNHLGVSPKDYIIDYRIKKAIEFLTDESISVGNVAYSVGYKDPLTFSKMFKLKVGMSPSEYRENNSQN